MKTIIFDFDGTIANSSIVFMNAWNEFAPQYGYLQVDESHIQQIRKLTIQQGAKKYNFPMIKLPFILPKMYSYVHTHIHEVEPYEGMVDVLHLLKKAGYKLVILSSNDQRNIESFLQHHQLLLFDKILTSSKLFGKDRTLKLYMKESGEQPHDIFYIGDELRDFEACKKCRIAFGWVSWGLQGEELIEAAGGIAEKFYEPAHIVKKLVD